MRISLILPLLQSITPICDILLMNFSSLGNFSRLQEDLKDSSTLEINYYATVPIKSVPNTMESLMELVESFPEQTQLVNKGVGVPLSMELFPLSALDSDLPRYIETK